MMAIKWSILPLTKLQNYIAIKKAMGTTLLRTATSFIILGSTPCTPFLSRINQTSFIVPKLRTKTNIQI